MIAYLTAAFVTFIFLLITLIGLDVKPPEMSNRKAAIVSFWVGVIWPAFLLLLIVGGVLALDYLIRVRLLKKG